MRLSASILAASLFLASGAMATHEQDAANHKRFVVARRALPPINILGGLVGGANPQAQGGASNAPTRGPISLGNGQGLLARDPLVGSAVPGLSGLTSSLNLNKVVGNSKKVLPVAGALARSEHDELAERAPLAGGLPLVGSLASALPLGNGAQQQQQQQQGNGAPQSNQAPKMIPVSSLKQRSPLGGGVPSLGGLTSELGLNSKGKTDSLLPVSLGSRSLGADGALIARTVQDATKTLNAAKNKLSGLFTSQGGAVKPVASKQVLIKTFEQVTTEVGRVTNQLTALKLAPAAAAGSNSEVAARDLTLPGLLSDLISTLNSLLGVLEPPVEQLLGDLLGAVADALKPYAGELITNLNNLLLTVEGIVQTLGLQLGPVLQPVLDLVQNLASALGLNLSN
ncbi:hypothetical protein OC842_004227 [Tilletia horrida]|uniref:Uncharacterized protein n=1 Tax=Tilletia horrida TaxID=155126 RepID=A0AAN6GA13_9BASI|nr:hypothetical protein OC842_004227 [Tilletia horrida]